MADAKGDVDISNVAGTVNVTGWDRNEVRVTGSLAEGVERLEFTSEGKRTLIKVVLKKSTHWGDDGGAELSIRVPVGSRLDVSTVSAEITVKGVSGTQRLQTVSGEISTDVATEEAELKTVSGDVQLTGSNPQANVRASSVSGDVDLIQVGGDVEARSTSGDVDIDSKGSSDLRAHTVSGDIEVRGVLASAADLDLQSVSGRVKVAAQAPAGFRYDVSSFSGSIRNCFGYNAERNDGPGNSHLNGVRGEGKGNLRMKSHSGTVDFCDH